MVSYLSIDIGGTAIKYGIYDDNYRCLKSDEIKTPLCIQEFLVCIEAIYTKAKMWSETIAGIAVSVPGSVKNNGEQLLGGCVSYLSGFNFKGWLEEKTGVLVAIENDGICALIAECRLGALQNCSNAMSLVFGTGIAGGILINDRIVRGNNYHAGEFSFIIMGAGFFNEETLWATDNGDYTLRQFVSEIKNIPAENLDGRKIFQMANSGDEEVKVVIDNYTKIIARNIFNLQAVLDVEKVAIGGGISGEKLFINGIINNLDKYKNMINSPVVLPKIVSCSFGKDANRIGALVNLKEE